jgi:hypothetical protein
MLVQRHGSKHYSLPPDEIAALNTLVADIIRAIGQGTTDRQGRYSGRKARYVANAVKQAIDIWLPSRDDRPQ